MVIKYKKGIYYKKNCKKCGLQDCAYFGNDNFVCSKCNELFIESELDVNAQEWKNARS